LQVIAVILAVFLNHGNGRAITSTINDNFESGMLDFAEEELNTILNETNENPIEREENPADVLRLAEPDSPSLEAVQFQFSDDVSGESIIKGSEKVILAMDANHVWPHGRQFRDDEPNCYTGHTKTILLDNGQVITPPVCRLVAKCCSCSSSKANNGGKRKCVESHIKAHLKDGVAKYFHDKCSCAP